MLFIEGMAMSLLKVGEVAKKSGLTVRALHHYDEIGLLIPSARSDSGYRLYTRDDLMQLQKIKSLQQLGFSLEEITSLTQTGAESLSDIINKHLQSLSLQVEHQQVLIERLRRLADILQQGKPPSVELLLDTLRVTVMTEKYYTPEQMEKLAQRKEKIGEEAINQAQQEWQNIFEQFRELYKKNEPVTCGAAQKLAKRSLELIDMFTSGDPGINKSLQNMYDTEGGENVLAGMDVDKALFAYVSEAMKLAKKS